MLTGSSSPIFCWKNVEEKIKRQYCVCGPASKWAVTSGVLNACQWESTRCLSLKGISHTHLSVSVRLTHRLCSEAAVRKTSREPFLALDFLFLGEDNAFLPYPLITRLGCLGGRWQNCSAARCVVRSLWGL